MVNKDVHVHNSPVFMQQPLTLYIYTVSRKHRTATVNMTTSPINNSY